MFSSKYKKHLLKKTDSVKWLKLNQIIKLTWWDAFNKKKSEAFYNGLNDGKSAISAFNDANNL